MCVESHDSHRKHSALLNTATEIVGFDSTASKSFPKTPWQGAAQMLTDRSTAPIRQRNGPPFMLEHATRKIRTMQEMRAVGYVYEEVNPENVAQQKESRTFWYSKLKNWRTFDAYQKNSCFLCSF
jgi:hypothetical protein